MHGCFISSPFRNPSTPRASCLASEFCAGLYLGLDSVASREAAVKKPVAIAGFINTIDTLLVLDLATRLRCHAVNLAFGAGTTDESQLIQIENSAIQCAAKHLLAEPSLP